MGGGSTTTSPWGTAGGMGGIGRGATQQQTGTGNPPYRPTVHHDNSSSVATYIQAITAMDAYKDKSFEELRWEDYQRGNNKGGGAGGGIGGGLGLGGATGGFGGGGGVGGGAFGTGATSTPGGFGSTGGAFGATQQQGHQQTPFGGSVGVGGFGTAVKPAGGGFGTTTPGGAFGTPSTGGTSLFGQTPGASGLGAFGSSGGGDWAGLVRRNSSNRVRQARVRSGLRRGEECLHLVSRPVHRREGLEGRWEGRDRRPLGSRWVEEGPLVRKRRVRRREVSGGSE